MDREGAVEVPAIEAPDPADVITGAISLFIVWMFFAAVVTSLRDPATWMRLARIGRLGRKKSSAASCPNVTSVRARARRIRWGYRLYAAYYWIAGGLWWMVFLALVAGGLSIIISGLEDPSGPRAMLILAVVLTLLTVPDRLVRKFRRRSADGRTVYQSLERKVLGWRYWLAVFSIGAVSLISIGLLFFASFLRELGGPIMEGDLVKIVRSSTELASLGVVLALASTALARREVGRQVRSRIDAIFEVDQRPQVVLLRSFVDDKLRLRVRRGPRHGLLDRLSLRRRDRFEEVVVWAMWGLGPVVAIADPSRNLSPVGAARLVGVSDWRESVRQLINQSAAVLVVVGATDNLLWEVDRLVDMGALERAVFVLPPVRQKEYDIRLIGLMNRLGIDFDADCLAGERVIALTLGTDMVMRIHTAPVPDDSAYLAAIEAIEVAPTPGYAIDAGAIVDRQPDRTPTLALSRILLRLVPSLLFVGFAVAMLFFAVTEIRIALFGI